MTRAEVATRRVVVALASGLVVVALTAWIAGWLLVRWSKPHAGDDGARSTAVAVLVPTPAPAPIPAPGAMPAPGATPAPGPAPALQTAPGPDAQAARTAQRQRLQSAGWVDRERGLAHIPIEDAMRVVADEHARAPREAAQP